MIQRTINYFWEITKSLIGINNDEAINELNYNDIKDPYNTWFESLPIEPLNEKEFETKKTSEFSVVLMSKKKDYVLKIL